MLEANKEDLQVFHMNEETQEAEEVAIESVANGEIEIIAESFSVYTIVINEGENESITISYDTNWGHFQDKLVKKDVVYTADEDWVFRAATDWKTPSREGYMFAGWYLEANWTTAWTWGVAANMTVYAKWLPFEDLTFTSWGTTIVMMDRNLGAANTWDAGYYYQWGNNYGFSKENTGSIVTTGVIENIWTNTPSTYYSSLWRTQTWETMNYDLWWNVTNTKEARQGPCPEGYYVPSSDEWKSLGTLLGSSGSTNKIEWEWSDLVVSWITAALYLPYAGILEWKGSSIVQGVSARWRYWSSTLKNLQDAYSIDFTLSGNQSVFNFYTQSPYLRAHTVRCFKDVDYDTYNITWDDVSRNNFGYDTIEIGDYLVMDRNLGAKAAWDKTWSESYETELDSYGYYYQRGNNHWFSSITTEAWADSAVTVADEYIPSWYASGVWNSAPAWSTQSNLWWDVTNTTVARQWPCPSGWYVPSMSDWENIYSAWQEENQWLTTKDFAEYLLLAPNGYRSNTLTYGSNRWTVGYYLSSDSYDNENSKYLKIGESTIDTGVHMYRSNGWAVRCIQYNPDHTVTFDANRWAIVDAQTVAHWGTATEPETSFPGYTFTGWYLEWEDIPFDFSTPITEDITLVARWTYNNVIQDLDIYMLGTDENSLWHVSMMDRNLGASSWYNKNRDTPNEQAFWYYIQWWM